MEKTPKNFPRKVLKKEWGLAEAFFPKFQDDITSTEDAEFFYKYFQEILRKHGLDLAKNVKVLEIGSRSAVFLDFLTRRGVNAVGVDVQPNRNKESPQVLARIEQLPFEGGSFDVVLSNAVFDAGIYDQYQSFMKKEIARVLKHGGIYLGNEFEFCTYKPPFEGLDIIPSNAIAVYKKP